MEADQILDVFCTAECCARCMQDHPSPSCSSNTDTDPAHTIWRYSREESQLGVWPEVVPKRLKLGVHPLEFRSYSSAPLAKSKRATASLR